MNGSDEIGNDDPVAKYDEYEIDSELDLPKWDGYDTCIVGIVYPSGPIIYNMELLTSVTMRKDGMTRKEAEEYIDFNMVSAHIGDYSPIYMIQVEDIEGVDIRNDED